MREVTKKQMVDFISSRCDMAGRRIPKSKWNQLSREQLIQVISYESQIGMALASYIERENEEKELDKRINSIKQENRGANDSEMGNKLLAESSQERIRELMELVDELVENPYSSVVIMNLKYFMMNLPYGMISNDDFYVVIEKIVEKSPTMARMTLDYVINQMLYEM